MDIIRMNVQLKQEEIDMIVTALQYVFNKKLDMVKRNRDVLTQSEINELLNSANEYDDLSAFIQNKTQNYKNGMKVVFISHPISVNIKNQFAVKENLEKLAEIIREINLAEPNVVPFAPYYADCIALDDKNEDERERGMRNSEALLRSGLVDEMRLHGEFLSYGMEQEMKLALELGIPVKRYLEDES